MTELTDDELWSIWNDKFSEDMLLSDFMAVANAIISEMKKPAK